MERLDDGLRSQACGGSRCGDCWRHVCAKVELRVLRLCAHQSQESWPASYSDLDFGPADKGIECGAHYNISCLANHHKLITYYPYDFLQASSLDDAEVVRVNPHPHKGEGEIVPLNRTLRAGQPTEISFTYQADKYVLATPDPSASVTSITTSPSISEPTFRRLPYPADAASPLSEFQTSRGLTTTAAVEQTHATFGSNAFDIPVPKFMDLFIEHAVAPFFVFQIFCVGLWMLDEYWYYSLFTLFMLVVFECTVVFQVGRRAVSFACG